MKNISSRETLQGLHSPTNTIQQLYTSTVYIYIVYVKYIVKRIVNNIF
jgi:hypothetical protein